jgi:hypothetical protein
MYEWWRTPNGHEDIDRFRQQLLVGIVNQQLGVVPSSLEMAKYRQAKDSSKSVPWPGTPGYDENDWIEGNNWFDFLRNLQGFIPSRHDYEFVMSSSAAELSMLICGTEFPGNSSPRTGKVPIDDPELLDLLAEFFAGLDGVFGFILATNHFMSADLRSELSKSDFHMMSSEGVSTKNLCKRAEEIEGYRLKDNS